MSVLTVDLGLVHVLEFTDADEQAPAAARAWLAGLLEAADAPQDGIDAAVLCVSELVTNAVVHGGGRVLASAELLEHAVRLVVHNDKAARAWQEPGGDHDERGRGLVLVAAMAELHVARSEHGVTAEATVPLTGFGTVA